MWLFTSQSHGLSGFPQYKDLPLGCLPARGEVSERPKETVLKTVDAATYPWVQIPPSPQKTRTRVDPRVLVFYVVKQGWDLGGAHRR